jgi:hypothetical protein
MRSRRRAGHNDRQCDNMIFHVWRVSRSGRLRRPIPILRSEPPRRSRAQLS